MPDYLPNAIKGRPFTDDFGCVWETLDSGIIGTVTGHPLRDLSGIGDYTFPDPAYCAGTGPINWEAEAAAVRMEKEKGWAAIRGLRHGHTFLQLCDICGYEELVFAMSDDDPRLQRLIDGLLEFNLGLVERYLALNPDVVTYAEDLGMQSGPMLTPDMFRSFIMPSYRTLMMPAWRSGALIHFHSDGDIRALAECLLETVSPKGMGSDRPIGVDIINIQDSVNGVGWIAGNLKGKVCIDLDIDRQQVTPFGNHAQIDELIRTEVQTLGSPQGGLTMVYGMYPGVPLENAAALMDAMERYALYYR